MQLHLTQCKIINTSGVLKPHMLKFSLSCIFLSAQVDLTRSQASIFICIEIKTAWDVLKITSFVFYLKNIAVISGDRN